jgi:outer membrane lipoprotein-sorting protein
MFNKFLFLFFCGFMAMAPVTQAQEIDAQQLIKKTQERYHGLKSFQADVTVTMDQQASGETTTGHILLGRPYLYKIDWDQESPHFNNLGVVWNSGSGPFYFMAGGDRYTKLRDDEISLSSAAGVSRGISHETPAVFFAFSKIDLLTNLKDLNITGSEVIRGEDCYLVEGVFGESQKEILWISKASYFILKTQKTIDSARHLEKMNFSDDQIKESLQATGQEINEENVENMKKMMEFSRQTLAQNPQKLTATIEYHNIVTDQNLTAADFEYTIPKTVKFVPASEFFHVDMDELRALHDQSQKIINQNTEKELSGPSE